MMTNLAKRYEDSTELDRTPYMAGWLLSQFKGRAIETLERIGSLEHFFVSFIDGGSKPISGHGHDQDRDRAILKGLVERLERETMRSAFLGPTIIARPLLKNGPETRCAIPQFKNSNGWAVHLTASAAIENAYAEALERHLLTVSFLTEGWRGFNLIDRTVVDEFEVLSLATRYSCNGYRAGMVILRGSHFSGVSFGYLCTRIDDLYNDRGWTHSLFEALGYWRRMTKIAPDQSVNSDPLFQAGIAYLNSPWIDPVFSDDRTIEALPDVDPLVSTEYLSQRINSPFDLYSAFVFGGGLVPLVLGQPRRDQLPDLSDALSPLGIRADDWPSRMPVL
jgi:hypothetical protein